MIGAAATVPVSLADLYQSHRRQVLAFLKGRVLNAAEAEDVLHDVFVRLMDGFDLTRPLEELVHLLFAAARNRAIDLYRRRSARQAALDRGRVEPESFFEEIIGAYTRQAASPREQDERLEAVVKAIEDLPDIYREILELQELEGLTFKEISASTGLPLNTLISRKRIALERLRQSLSAIERR